MLLFGPLDYSKCSICLWLLLELCSRTYCENYKDSAGQIIGTIFHKYNAAVLPWSNYPKPINIDLYVTPIHVHGIDPVNKVMTSTIDIRIKWVESFLGWFEEMVEHLTVRKDEVWQPSISIFNAVGKTVEIDNPNLVLSRSGEITMHKRMYVNTVCDTGGNKEFNCTIDVGTVLYSSDVIVVDNSSIFDTRSLTFAKGFTLQNASAEIGEQMRWKDDSNTTYSVYSCTLSILNNDCCDSSNGGGGDENAQAENMSNKQNGVTSLRPYELLIALTLLIGVLAFK